MSDESDVPPSLPVRPTPKRKRPYRRRQVSREPPVPTTPSPDEDEPPALAIPAASARPRITVTPRSDEATWSTEDILKARLEGQNPFGRVNDNSLPLKDKAAWHQRWFNNQVNPSQVHMAQRRMGWVPVRVEDLEEGTTVESLGFTVAPDGTIRRGDRNTEEVILKMPEATYRAIQMRKTEANTKGMGSEKAAKTEAAEAVSGAHGSQAADYISQHAHITIRDRVTGS